MAEIIYAPEAKEETKAAAKYYEECQKGLGNGFLDAIDLAVKNLSESPYLYRKLRGQFRRCLVDKFPFGIIYTIQENKIFIASVMHLKRKPGYWLKRIE